MIFFFYIASEFQDYPLPHQNPDDELGRPDLFYIHCIHIHICTLLTISNYEYMYTKIPLRRNMLANR